VLSGRLFGSITYKVTGNMLMIGPDVPYAAVHQFGSRDYRGNFTGPLNRPEHEAYEAERVGVPMHGRQLFGTVIAKTKGGRNKKIREVQGGVLVGKHQRHQNIPPRPYLVFRPEDPQKMAEGIQGYLAERAGRGGLG
jgi:phage gpG-like protein